MTLALIVLVFALALIVGVLNARRLARRRDGLISRPAPARTRTVLDDTGDEVARVVFPSRDRPAS